MQAAPAQVLENLSRLASKPGVQSTLILSKNDGAIIRSSGFRSVSPQPTSAIQDMHTRLENEETASTATSINGTSYPGESDGQAADRSAEAIARVVFAFVVAAGKLAHGVEDSNEVQLLRLRTRKNEIVIVPDARYLLVVIHDPPKST